MIPNATLEDVFREKFSDNSEISAKAKDLEISESAQPNLTNEHKKLDADAEKAKKTGADSSPSSVFLGIFLTTFLGFFLPSALSSHGQKVQKVKDLRKMLEGENGLTKATVNATRPSPPQSGVTWKNHSG